MKTLPITGTAHPAQVPFTLTSKFLRSALLLGSGGGFALACILTLSPLFGIPLGNWWTATVQTHGHLQLYGWAALFVAGVALYFLPRLRGVPLAWQSLLPWILGILVTSLVLRFISQPLLAATGEPLWKSLLVLSAVLEVLAFPGIFSVLLRTLRQERQSAGSTEGIQSIAPFIFGAFLSLTLASILNLINCLQAPATNGLIPGFGDSLNVNLGLFGFLVPVALAMSARMLPLYARITPFPTRLLWTLSSLYFVGVICTLFPVSQLNGAGFLLTGGVVLTFTGYFIHLMRHRTQIPSKVAALAPSAEAMKERIKNHRLEERRTYGPYVGLIGSAFTWGSLGAAILVIDGLGNLLFASLPLNSDAARHSFTLGFITLLICGISTRMIPGFSSRAIRSPRLVSALLYLGNLAAVLRIFPLLLPFLPAGSVLFALSGPVGLALIICLAVNLWPAL